jgi:hypothetical protein
VGASERDEFLRAAWWVLVAGRVETGHFVFVDECSTNTSLTPLYAWSRRGERARCSIPRNWGANVTLLSSMSIEGMGPSLAVEGSTTREVFEAYLKQVLGPALKKGQVMVMDNQPFGPQRRWGQRADRGARLRAHLLASLLARSQSHREEAFSKIKSLLRKAQARSRERLMEAMGRAISAVTARDAQGFFEHRGYRLVAQQP